MLTLSKCDNAIVTNEYIKSLIILNHPELKIVPSEDVIDISDNINVIMISGNGETGKTQCMISSV